MNSEAVKLESMSADGDYNAFVQQPPEWVPPPLVEAIQAIHEGLLEEERTSQEIHEVDPGFWHHSDEVFLKRRLLLKRLASDPRMRGVWSEIYKKRRVKYRPTNKFWHPANREGLQQVIRPDVFPSGDASELQDFAARFLLENAFSIAGWPPPFLSKAEVRSQSEPFLEVADALRAEASKLSSLSFGGGPLADQLQEIATTCEQIAERVNHPPYFIPVASRPDQGDKTIRAYVLGMAAVCKIAFGKSLYGTITRIANVALGADLKPRAVREMLRPS
jgi:hypothetical protein